MKRREALVIGLLIVLALCVPALILHGGMKDARDRAWRERPYEGTLADFQQEHIGLLNEAAEIFSAHPAFFEQYFEWSGDATATIWRDEARLGQLRHGMLSEAEWDVVTQLFAEQRCTSVYYEAGLYSPSLGWVEIPMFTFRVRTMEDAGSLLWLPEETRPEAAEQALRILRQDRRIEKTAYPNWYAVW